MDAINANQWDEFQKIRKKLDGYILHPYLDYNYLLKNLSKISSAEIHRFSRNYPDFPYQKKLYESWLFFLASQKKWQFYRQEYESLPIEIDTIALQCHYLHALYQTGDVNQALAYVNPLWEVNRSQPDACDPVFTAWSGSDTFSEKYAWKRVSLVIQAGNYSLANYLAREYLPKHLNDQAKRFIDVRKNPNLLKNIEDFKQKDAYTREIIQVSIIRLMRINSELATELWEDYQKIHNFSQEEKQQINTQIALWFARRYHENSVDWLKKSNQSFENNDLNEVHLRVLIRMLKWSDYLQAFDKMPANFTEHERWQYWRARAIEESSKRSSDLKKAQEIYKNLAKERSFYGFLSADKLNQPYQLNHESIKVSSKQLKAIESRPAILRSKEFLALNQITAARIEWRHMLYHKFNKEELLAAAKIAEKWKWLDQGIWALIKAESWNDLDIRFPLAYKTLILQYAKKNNLDAAWLFSIARQESAFRADARSHSNALGLLQLLPSTAKDTAKKIKFNYNNSHMLLKPENNVPLGSAYLRMMAEKFNGNRALASAAYNAGPNRVNRWLTTSSHLPIDVWIESIPFNETRQYVQNVLSFSVIYATKLGVKNIDFIKPQESQLADALAKKE